MSGTPKAFALAAVLSLSALASAAQAAESCNVAKFAELPTDMHGMRARVSFKIEGQPTTFMIDSGAFFSIMNRDTVDRLKLSVQRAPFGFRIEGVGGSENQVDVATVKKFGLGPYDLANIRFLVVPHIAEDAAGVIGQNVLSVFDTEYDLGNGIIRLMKPSSGCAHANLAYWAGGQAVGVIDIDAITPEHSSLRGRASLNGRDIRVTFDTGSPYSILKTSTAEKAGFRPDAPGVRANGVASGLGSRVAESWTAPFDALDLGGEKITNTRLWVAGINLPDADMLLGADFFLSHRVYVSKQQRRIFFTYNGGPVFRLDSAARPPAPSVAAAPAPGAPAPAAGKPLPAEYANAPTDAAGYSRRGEASMSRRNYAAAVADFSKAVELEPGVPQHYRDRAAAHMAGRQPLLAMADFDQALKLAPNDPASLIGRGELFLASRDLPRAKADFDAAMKAEPDRALQVGAIYTASGHYEEAVGLYDSWIAGHQNGANLASVLNARCWTRTLWNHDLDRALADCDAALKRGPRVAALYDSRGLAHLRRKEFDAAIADYDQALKLQPKLGWALMGRGLAKRGKGDAAGGDADIAAATEIQPNLPNLARRYGLMEGAPARTAAAQ